MSGTNQKTTRSKRSKSSRTRGALSEAARQLSLDNAAIKSARWEVQGLDETDLAGEISMLRVTLKRVFSLTSQVAAELAAANQQRQRAPQGAKPIQEKMIFPEEPRKGPVKKEPHVANNPFTSEDSPLEKSLDTWIQALDSLGQGATRLANLMRAHKALRSNATEVISEALEQQAVEVKDDLFGEEKGEEGGTNDGR